jgi:hypothetical protein
MLIWQNNGPWKRTIVYRDTVKHNFPFPHADGLEQFIDLEMPMEKASEVAAFNGSVILHLTTGEISACCHDEKSNFMAINLAHDILQDKKTFEQARDLYVQNMLAFLRGQPVPYMEKFQFSPEINTADPDESIISPEKILQTAKSSSSEPCRLPSRP